MRFTYDERVLYKSRVQREEHPPSDGEALLVAPTPPEAVHTRLRGVHAVHLLYYRGGVSCQKVNDANCTSKEPISIAIHGFV